MLTKKTLHNITVSRPAPTAPRYRKRLSSRPGADDSVRKAILELGCGNRKLYPDSVGVDICPTSAADLTHDLNTYPYPFEDNSFDLVVCMHVLEHLDDVVRTVTEIHRVLRPGGMLHVEVPHFSSFHAFSDPTHKHFFSSKSFDYFFEGTPVSEFDYSNARFVLRRRELMVGGSGLVRGLMRRWINSHLDFYEKHIAFLMPRHTLVFDLQAVK